jgi:NADH:ubiquinone oxidoreductase subunit 6 (subunit J)
MDAKGAKEATGAKDAEAKRAKWWAETKMDLKWATALLFVLILAVSGYLWNAWGEPTDGEEVLVDLTDEIFAQDGLVVPFEILSVLLLAALIAGVVIAMRDPEGGA